MSSNIPVRNKSIPHPSDTSANAFHHPAYTAPLIPPPRTSSRPLSNASSGFSSGRPISSITSRPLSKDGFKSSNFTSKIPVYSDPSTVNPKPPSHAAPAPSRNAGSFGRQAASGIENLPPTTSSGGLRVVGKGITNVPLLPKSREKDAEAGKIGKVKKMFGWSGNGHNKPSTAYKESTTLLKPNPIPIPDYHKPFSLTSQPLAPEPTPTSDSNRLSTKPLSKLDKKRSTEEFRLKLAKYEQQIAPEVTGPLRSSREMLRKGEGERKGAMPVVDMKEAFSSLPRGAHPATFAPVQVVPKRSATLLPAFEMRKDARARLESVPPPPPPKDMVKPSVPNEKYAGLGRVNATTEKGNERSKSWGKSTAQAQTSSVEARSVSDPVSAKDRSTASNSDGIKSRRGLDLPPVATSGLSSTLLLAHVDDGEEKPKPKISRMRSALHLKPPNASPSSNRSSDNNGSTRYGEPVLATRKSTFTLSRFRSQHFGKDKTTPVEPSRSMTPTSAETIHPPHSARTTYTSSTASPPTTRPRVMGGPGKRPSVTFEALAKGDEEGDGKKVKGKRSVAGFFGGLMGRKGGKEKDVKALEIPTPKPSIANLAAPVTHVVNRMKSFTSFASKVSGSTMSTPRAPTKRGHPDEPIYLISQPEETSALRHRVSVEKPQLPMLHFSRPSYSSVGFGSEGFVSRFGYGTGSELGESTLEEEGHGESGEPATGLAVPAGTVYCRPGSTATPGNEIEDSFELVEKVLTVDQSLTSEYSPSPITRVYRSDKDKRRSSTTVPKRKSLRGIFDDYRQGDNASKRDSAESKGSSHGQVEGVLDVSIDSVAGSTFAQRTSITSTTTTRHGAMPLESTFGKRARGYTGQWDAGVGVTLKEKLAKAELHRKDSVVDIAKVSTATEDLFNLVNRLDLCATPSSTFTSEASNRPSPLGMISPSGVSFAASDSPTPLRKASGPSLRIVASKKTLKHSPMKISPLRLTLGRNAVNKSSIKAKDNGSSSNPFVTSGMSSAPPIAIKSSVKLRTQSRNWLPSRSEGDSDSASAKSSIARSRRSDSGSQGAPRTSVDQSERRSAELTAVEYLDNNEETLLTQQDDDAVGSTKPQRIAPKNPSPIPASVLPPTLSREERPPKLDLDFDIPRSEASCDSEDEMSPIDGAQPRSSFDFTGEYNLLSAGGVRESFVEQLEIFGLVSSQRSNGDSTSSSGSGSVGLPPALARPPGEMNTQFRFGSSKSNIPVMLGDTIEVARKGSPARATIHIQSDVRPTVRPEGHVPTTSVFSVQTMSSLGELINTGIAGRHWVNAFETDVGAGIGHLLAQRAASHRSGAPSIDSISSSALSHGLPFVSYNARWHTGHQRDTSYASSDGRTNLPHMPRGLLESLNGRSMSGYEPSRPPSIVREQIEHSGHRRNTSSIDSTRLSAQRLGRPAVDGERMFDTRIRLYSITGSPEPAAVDLRHRPSFDSILDTTGGALTDSLLGNSTRSGVLSHSANRSDSFFGSDLGASGPFRIRARRPISGISQISTEVSADEDSRNFDSFDASPLGKKSLDCMRRVDQQVAETVSKGKGADADCLEGTADETSFGQSPIFEKPLPASGRSSGSRSRSKNRPARSRNAKNRPISLVFGGLSGTPSLVSDSESSGRPSVDLLSPSQLDRPTGQTGNASLRTSVGHRRGASKGASSQIHTIREEKSIRRLSAELLTPKNSTEAATVAVSIEDISGTGGVIGEQEALLAWVRWERETRAVYEKSREEWVDTAESALAIKDFIPPNTDLGTIDFVDSSRVMYRSFKDLSLDRQLALRYNRPDLEEPGSAEANGVFFVPLQRNVNSAPLPTKFRRTDSSNSTDSSPSLSVEEEDAITPGSALLARFVIPQPPSVLQEIVPESVIPQTKPTHRAITHTLDSPKPKSASKRIAKDIKRTRVTSSARREKLGWGRRRKNDSVPPVPALPTKMMAFAKSRDGEKSSNKENNNPFESDIKMAMKSKHRSSVTQSASSTGMRL